MPKKCLLVVACVVIALAWWLYDPIPDEFSEPWKLRIAVALMKISLTASRVLHSVGFMHPHDTFEYFERLFSTYGPQNLDLPGLSIRNVDFEGVPVRLYQPIKKNPEKDSAPKGGMVWYHGGGWALGDAYGQDSLIIKFVRNLNIVVASVDYRLAPEHVFPVPFEDSLLAATHFLVNAARYDVDPKRVALAGDSAGGNLAAAVAIKLRDDSFHIQPKLQLLVYPALQAIDFMLPSFIQNSAGPQVDADLLAWFWSVYISGDSRHVTAFLNNSHVSPEIRTAFSASDLNHMKLDKKYRYAPYRQPNLNHGNRESWTNIQNIMLSPYFAPLLVQDATGLPKTYVFTAQYDVLRDEGILYVIKLREAGVFVEHNHAMNGFHGVFNDASGFEESLKAISDFEDFLRRNM